MRLGGPVDGPWLDPGEWVRSVRAAGYRAAYAPVGDDADDTVIDAFRNAAAANDILIAEAGAWCNPLSPDPAARAAALAKCKRTLLLAERLGARCCVNIAGSRGMQWDGPDPRNLTDETFQMIVEVTREIIDAVGPVRTFYTLETMPWMYPDSVDSYGALVKAIDREHFAVHYDPVNLINSPERFFRQAHMMREFVKKLGAHIKSCHLKDAVMSGELTLHISETRPGTGALDYPVLLGLLDRLGRDLPVMLEHLPREQYPAAAQHVRDVARKGGIAL